jgi:hypothetical protein
VSAALALRSAVYAMLRGDAVLGEVLGGAKVYDEVPGTAAPPYVVLSEITTRNTGTTDEPSEEHELTVEVWSRQAGLAESLTAADRIVAALDGGALAVSGHRLADFIWLATAAQRSRSGRYRSARVTFRAATEPA